jgi:DNA-binding NtrC family response regulator
LRERRSDIPDLARHLLARAARRPIEQVAGLLSASAIEVLVNCDWPGNVRELANSLEYAYIVSGGQTITGDHFPAHMLASHSRPATIPMPASLAAAPAPTLPTHGSLHEVEMAHILRVLEKHNGHKASAANELGISLKTLYNKLNKYEEERRAAAG